MRRLLRHAFTVCSAISLLLCVAVVAFFFGKRFGYDDQAMPVTPLYWLGWRADGLYWLSSGRIFGIDLELFLALIFALLPIVWLCIPARNQLGRCGRCRYDLRAHAKGERCPECGTAVGGAG